MAISLQPEAASGAKQSGLRIDLLGQFTVFIRGRALAGTNIRGRKARSLLKLLALQRQGQVVRDQAFAALWPELGEEAAAAQLYKAVHYIRRAFAEIDDDAAEWVEVTDDLIRLAPPGTFETDAQHFDELARSGLRDSRVSDLEAAVPIYAGDLLPMDLYAEWTALPREHYRQIYLDVLTALAAHYEQFGRLHEAGEMSRLALEKDPALESAHRGLMRIFARQGQLTRGLRQFDRCRDALRRELDLEPSAETVQMLEELRRWNEVEPPRHGGAMRPTFAAPMPPLIDRDEECSAIDSALERLSGGAGGVLVIRGDMGMGKTHLLKELSRRARQRGLRDFSGAARESGETTAYGPIVELLDSLLPANRGLQEQLPEELGRLVPSFSGTGVPTPHTDRLAAQGYLFAQTLRFFEALATSGPIVIIVDDLHAADEGTRALLDYLMRHGQALPILFAVTTREDLTGTGAPVDRDRDGGHMTVLELRPLAPDGHARLLQHHAHVQPPSADTAEQIFRLSEGNPLFAVELLRFNEVGNGIQPSTHGHVAVRPNRGSSTGSVPPSLRQVVDRQLADLSAAAQHLLYMAAVIGRHVPYDVLESVWTGGSTFDDESLFDAIEEVTRAQLLEERGLDYTFRHLLVQEAIYQSISAARRRALHGRVAQRLIATSSDRDDPPVEQIARHLVSAGELWQGAHYLIRTAERAESAYAHEEALARYRDALAVLEELGETRARRRRRDVLSRIGDVYRACGRLEQSFDAYEQAVALAEEVPLSGSDLVELHRKIALVAIFRTEMERSERHLTWAFELLKDDPRARARLLIIQALHYWHLNKLEEAYDVAREALLLAEASEAAAEASQACEILAMTCLPLSRWEEGLGYEMRRQVHGWSPEIVVATDAHLCLWEYHVAGDEPFQRAQSFIRSVSEQASEMGDLRCVAVCHYALGTMHLWRGHRPEASEALEASLQLHEDVGSPAGKAYVLARKAVLHTLQGESHLGWEAVQEGIANAEQAAVRDHCLQRLYGVGIWNRLEADDAEQARDLATRAVALVDESGACAACALELYPWLAYFYLRIGEVTRAQDCQRAVADLAAMTGNPIGRAAAAIIESSLRVLEQDKSQADQLRREAFEFAESAAAEATHSPVVYFLDSMVDQQRQLLAAGT